MQRKKRRYSVDDDIVAVGGLLYTDIKGFEFPENKKKTTSKMLASNRDNKLSTMVSPILNRNSVMFCVGTKHQMRDLKDIIGDRVDTLTELNGTEERLRRKIERKNPEILHIATHGFNRVGSQLTNEEKVALIGYRDDNYVSPLEMSMYETGLYLSPNKNTKTPISDGILTAKEISMIDLSKTHLTVLSACSTTSGVIDSEGIYGLPRALKLAGVESMIVSLWDVDDNATEILMREFYSQLKQGASKRVALRNAQKYVANYHDPKIIAGKEYPFADPYYWAAFILIDGNE